MQLVRFDPTREFHKSVVGAVGEDVKFGMRLQINNVVSPSAVFLVINGDDGVFNCECAMYKDVSGDGFDNYLADISLKKGLYWYHFRMEGVPYESLIGIDESLSAAMYYDNVHPWQLSVYRKQYETPSWLNNGVMYQIMPDRFFGKGKVTPDEDKIMRNWGEQPFFREEDGTVKNRDFFGGNLRGIMEKLPYLRSLNVRTLYLNPIFKAYSNHKYDTEDYEEIDPMFGTEEDFKQLCLTADEMGINIVLDGVFNHVGSSSRYFNKEGKYGKGGAWNDKNSPCRDWFNFYEEGGYECWWNFETLPRINAESEGAQKYFAGDGGIVQKWLAAGASGWRLDVVDEIADCMLDKIVAAAKKKDPTCAIIGEVWEDASNKTDYGVRRRYFEGAQLDSVMNYPLKNAVIDFVRDGNVYSMRKTVFAIMNNYPYFVRNNLMNILGTHDTVRILTTLAGDRLENTSKEVMAKAKLSEAQYKRATELLKMCAVLQYTMFGFPCVYYGDEVGMEGYKDPFCRGCYPWGRENKLLLDFYRRLGELRNMHVFTDGDFHETVAEKGVYAFERISADSGTAVTVALNRGCEAYKLYLGGIYVDLLTGRQYTEICDLQPDEYVILERKRHF